MTKLSLIVVAGLGLIAAPLAAQNFSDSFNFLKAVKERDGATVERLLANPSSAVINTRDTSTGEGALHVLTRGRELSWLTFLLGKRARPDIQNKDGATPLSIAAQLGWVEGAALLLRSGANVDLPNRLGETPLILAVQNRDASMVRLLLAGGASPTRRDSSTGYSALDHAKRDTRAATILKLLQSSSTKPARQVAGPKL
jgi:ankyrin repeat protein